MNMKKPFMSNKVDVDTLAKEYLSSETIEAIDKKTKFKFKFNLFYFETDFQTSSKSFWKNGAFFALLLVLIWIFMKVF